MPAGAEWAARSVASARSFSVAWRPQAGKAEPEINLKVEMNLKLLIVVGCLLAPVELEGFLPRFYNSDQEVHGSMATSNPSFAATHIASSSSGQSVYAKLNSQWHERALYTFMGIVLAHWGEHLAQATRSK